MTRTNTFFFYKYFYLINTFQLLLRVFDHHQKITLYNVIKKVT
jgi:hypothetical protein